MHVAYIHMHIYALMTVIKIMMVVMLLLMMIKMKIIIINLSGQRVCGIFNEHATPPRLIFLNAWSLVSGLFQKD